MGRLRFAFALAAIAYASGTHAQGKLVDVVEFYNATLDHYFISSLADDIAALDSGRLPGWSRTELGFKAYDGPTADTSPVCRFYIPPSAGDSHFYAASPAECADVRQKFPTFSFESSAVMYVGLPNAASGACAAGTIPVYRLWNKRADTNHRYTTDVAVRDAMVAQGYVPEGYGAEGVAMCAVPGGKLFDITLAPSSLTLMPGEARDVYVTVTARNGFAGPVTLSLTGLPAGVTQEFASPTVAVDPMSLSTTVRITASPTAPVTPTLPQAAVTGSEGGGFATSRSLGVGVAAPDDPVAARLRTIAAIEVRVREFREQGLTGLPFVQAVAAHMATLPDFATWGVDDETIAASGQFKDGTLLVVAANRDPDPAVTTAPLSEPRAGAELPGRTRATLLHSFGRNFSGQIAVEQMRSYFRSKSWAVDGGSEGEAHVGTLKAIRDKGFFYLNSHSGRAVVPDPTEPEGKIFSMQTSTLVDADYDRLFLAELLTIQLLYFMADNGDEIRNSGGTSVRVMDTRYAFTYRFVAAFMSFPKGSVVFMNGCYTGLNDRFANSFLTKGAGAYFGWTGSVGFADAVRAPTFLVDRMLGANQHTPKESPPQRAFPSDLVFANMKDRQIGFHATNQLFTRLNPTLADPPILAPSIRMAAIDEFDGLLTLHGYFGSETGTVTVGGANRNVISWKPDEIVTDLPLTGAGSSGDVIVEVRGVRSNARQITQWTVAVNYLRDRTFLGGHKYQGSGTMRFRGDIAGWRTLPGEPPTFVQRGGYATKDSKIVVTASGTWNPGGCASTLSGTGTYVSIAATRGLATTIPVTMALFGVNADSKAAEYGFLLAGEQYPHVATACNGQQTGSIASIGNLKGNVLLPTSQMDEPNPSGVPGFKFTLDTFFGMPKQTSTEGTAGSILGVVTVSTEHAAAASPPRDTVDSGK